MPDTQRQPRWCAACGRWFEAGRYPAWRREGHKRHTQPRKELTKVLIIQPRRPCFLIIRLECGARQFWRELSYWVCVLRFLFKFKMPWSVILILASHSNWHHKPQLWQPDVPMSSRLIRRSLGDSPGVPVVKMPRFHCRGHRFDSWED